MTNVFVAAYQHPLQTAKAFATLDALSGGRTIVGVGVGHVEGEFEVLGVPFKERGARTDEAIDAITAALTDEWPEHSGDYWSFKDVGQRPRPVQDPRPPIWVGGYGKPALRRVAARGDGWIPQGTPRKQLPDDIVHPAPSRRSAPGCGTGDGVHHRDGVRRRAELRHRAVLRFRLTRTASSSRSTSWAPSASVICSCGRESIRAGALRPGAAFGTEVGPYHPARSLRTKGVPVPLLTMRQTQAPAFGSAPASDIYRQASSR
jgi:hypothetical protein